MGHKRPFRPILAQCPLQGVKRTFARQWIEEIFSQVPECPLFAIAVVPTARKPEIAGAANGQKRTIDD